MNFDENTNQNQPPPIAKEFSEKIDLRFFIKALITYKASDLHLKAGAPPIFRIQGKLRTAKMQPLNPSSLEKILKQVLNTTQKEILENKRQVDLSLQLENLGSVRINIYYQNSSLAAAIRRIPERIPNLKELGTPDILKNWIQKKRGLILITGPTGSGKSTTLASLVEFANQTMSVHVITLEDPIEFVYSDQKGLITQREIGVDVRNFQEGIISALRQDPDLLVIGELRDSETLATALTAAETGHLVLTTLHTNGAVETIHRILNLSSEKESVQIRTQLGTCLVGVLSQLLIPNKNSKRILACEVMSGSPTIESYLIEGNLEKISQALTHSSSVHEMRTLNEDLQRLIQEGQIDLKTALKFSPAPDELKNQLEGLDRIEGYVKA